MTNVNEIHRAYELGQSFWLDYIRRDLIEDGELAGLIEANEIRGVTSNPSIFKQAIGESDLYLTAMRPLAHAGWSAEQIFEALAVTDIRSATDLFLPLYEGTDGRDGYVSIEVNPELAADTERTLEEARRLWKEVNRPNLMVKIPATVEGIPAIEQAIFEGININVTLIFSLDRYSEVMEAYLSGLERRAESGKPLERVASVASFFVSRVDTAVDQSLEATIRQEGSGAERAHSLLGKAAIANAKLAYAQFKLVFDGDRFERLRESGARVQRPLWASTSTKNPAYSDVMYVDDLIGQHTVNTVPPKTLEAFREHGVAEARLEAGFSEARAQLEALETLGISLDEVTLQLEREGVRSFAEAYGSLIETVRSRAEGMRGELGHLAAGVSQNLEQLHENRVAPRFWRVDPELWPGTKGGSVIKLRLEWLQTEPGPHLDDVMRRVSRLRNDQFKQLGWIGGGRERQAIAEAVRNGIELIALDTIDPQDVRAFARHTPADSTAFVAESRTTGDPSVLARVAGVWQRASNRLGIGAEAHFSIVALEGSELGLWAREHSVDPLEEWNLSSLPPVSTAGFLAAVLLGGEPAQLVEAIVDMKARCAPGRAGPRNPGLYLGAVLAAAGSPIHLLADPSVEARAEWLVGYVRARIRLPLRIGLPASHDSTVIYLRSDGELDQHVRQEVGADNPIVILDTDPGQRGMGAESVRWEMAVAVAAHLLGDLTYADAPLLPDRMQLSKQLKLYQKKGRFEFQRPTWEAEYGEVWWGGRGKDAEEPADLLGAAQVVIDRLAQNRPLILGLYRPRTRSDRAALLRLGNGILAGEHMTLEFDAGRPPEAKMPDGLILLIAGVPKQDSEVPALGVSYGDLQVAAMLSDFEKIKDSGAEVLAFKFNSEDAGTTFLKNLAELTSDGRPMKNVAAKQGVELGH